MAVTFQITDGTTTVNFANTTGPELENEYLPVFATPTGDGTIPPDVTEAIPVLLHIATDNGLAATMQDIANLARMAQEYMSDSNQATPVWFHRKLTAETGPVRYLVKSVSYTPNARFGGFFDVGPAITDGRWGVMTIVHHPYGEQTTAVAASGTDNISVLGGVVNYTDVVGDVPARIYFLNVDDLDSVTYKIWCGFRSDTRAAGDAALVAPLWEVEDGTPGTDAAVTTDATASPGGAGNTKTRVTFATQTGWYNRATLRMSDITANEANQSGEFLVLLRAKVNTGTAQVKLRQLQISTNIYRDGPIIDVADTTWNIYTLGLIQFPIRDRHAMPVGLFADSYDQSDALQIWGRVKPGEDTPTQTDLDCLILLPSDELFIHVETAVAAATNDAVYVSVSPEDTASAINVDTTGPYFKNPCPVSIVGPGVPVGDGRAFFCLAQSDSGTAPAIAETFDVELSTYPRWVFFRGAE